MSDFVSCWTEWETAEMASQTTDRTDESQKNTAAVRRQRTDTTDKSPSVGFVSEQPKQRESRTEPDLMAVTCDEVETMTLTAFAQAGLVLIVHSEVLGSEVLFVSDNVSEDGLDEYDMPIYRAEELKKLAWLRPGPRELRQLHMVKDIFQGSITGVEEADDG